MISHFMQFARNLSSPRTFTTYRDKRQTYRPSVRRHDTDLSSIFGSRVPGLPQNHDVVKARCRKRYENFRRTNNMTQLSLVTCGHKLTFPCFRRVLILCMLCTDYCNNFTTYSYLFFPDTIMPVFLPSLVV